MFLHAAIIAITLAAEPAAERPAPSAEQVELLKTFRAEFVPIHPGRKPFPVDFKMGSDSASAAERPAHKVEFPDREFFIAKYEVPQNLWQAVMGNNPSRWQGKRNAVEMLSFGEAEKFCGKVTALMRATKQIEARQKVRLPSEAEWEYCARAGTSTIYSFGNAIEQLGDYAWFHGNAAGNDPAVGAKKPNVWQLYDLHGYLWEWCTDEWHPTYEGAPTDGSAWVSKEGAATHHVLRGGSWKDPADKLTSSYRRGAIADTRDDAVGLRCVLSE